MTKRYSRKQRRVQLQQKANPMYAGMTLIDGMTQPRSMPRNYRSYAKEGYGGNDTLFKVVNYAITNGAAIPPILFTDETMTKRIEKHPLLDKLKRPNPEMTGVFLRKAVIGYFLISGNCFLFMNRAAKSGPPDELWTLPPDKVRPIPDENRGITGYMYDDWPAEKNPIPPQLIGHLRSWNPEDPFFGMSPVQVAAIMIDQQTDARKWNLSLFQNFLKPPGAWTTEALLSKNDRVKLEERVNEKMAGYRNAGKAPVLDGALKWQSSAVPPSEMDWINSMKFNAGSIANVYNMPPQLIGDTSSTTYDNFQQAEVVSYTEFIFPALDDFYGVLNMWLVPLYPDLCDNRGVPTAFLYYDKETVEVIQQVLQAKKDAMAQRGGTGFIQGTMMLDEARELQGLPPLPGGAGKVFRIGAILVPADKIMDYAEQSLSEPAAPPMPQPEPLSGPSAQQPPLQGNGQGNTAADGGKPAANEQEQKPANNEKNPPKETSEKSTYEQMLQMVKDLPSTRSLARVQVKALDLETAEQKKAYMESVEVQRARWEDEAEKRIADYFKDEHAAVKKAVENAAMPSTAYGRASRALDKSSDALKDVLYKLYQDVAVDVGQETLKQFKKEAASHERKGIVDDFLKLFSSDVLVYLLSLAGQKIQQITESTRAEIQSTLSDGVAAGESIPKLAKRIDDLYLPQIIPNRSKVIARTEVVGASNFAAVQAAKQSGLTLNKVWLATEDSRTRPDHADADGQEVGMDEKFTVGGVEMDRPGDPSAPADLVINCRCTIYFKRVKTQDTTNDETDEKRLRRQQYKDFMDRVLV